MMTDSSSRLPAVLASPRAAVRTSLPAALTRRTPPPTPAPAAAGWWKAAFDRAASAVLLAAALPVVAACLVLVRVTSSGPALYSQRRVGRGGRVFTLWKIRTMYHDCESLTGPRWSMPGDPRITPVGKILRDLHLDELPQLWNVIRGDMSLVGPRPERPEIVKSLKTTIVGYDRRHAVRPGITGFAQIHLPPDTCVRSVRNKLTYDLFYIRNRTPGMELFILLATGMKLFGLRRLYRRPPRRPAED